MVEGEYKLMSNTTAILKRKIHPYLPEIKKIGETDITYNRFKQKVQVIFERQVYLFGDTETIYHIELEKQVDRDSYDGEEAESIQCDRRFKSFYKELELWQYYNPSKPNIEFKPIPSLAERLERNKV
tara:strand:+ start:144 stop:524 length:381 start_codon:yes stop_codon:yes gene_type:complete